MTSFFKRFGKHAGEHISDGDLLGLMDGELPSARPRQIHRHLEQCWDCRRRYTQVQDTVFQFVDYRKRLTDPYLPPAAGGRDIFLRRMQGAVEHARRPWWVRLVHPFRALITPVTNPVLVSVVIVAAAVTLLWVWRQHATSVSTNEFLTRAQAGEQSLALDARKGVVFQRVRFQTRSAVVERTIYRDAQGRRHPRRQVLSPENEPLREKLAKAGVNWDAPFSATDYAEWRHRSSPTRDDVTRSGQHLLTLTTTPLRDDEVLKETITVRDTDFQGVNRTVELRDTGTIEIAQLNYDVLPWAAVNQDWFEPLPAGSATDAPGILPPHASRPAPELVLETELAVRYALHTVGADLGEPIEIRLGGPGTASVSVTGVVSSTKRKQDLLAVLSRIPGVAARLRTDEEAAPPHPATRVMRVEPLIAAAHSPFEKELRTYFGDSQSTEKFSESIIKVARDLMAHAWALRHLSERYEALQGAGGPALTPASLQLLEAMRRDHHRAISEATSQLTTSLRPVLLSMVQAEPEPATKPSLFDCAQRVHRLTTELVLGSVSPDGNDIEEPTKAARALLDALRGLEIALEEQP